MRVAICIMSTMCQPSIRNNEAFKETVIKYCNDNADKLKNEYEFFFYYSTRGFEHMLKDDVYSNTYHLYINEMESVYRTYEKTCKCLKYVKENFSPDLYVRINISTYININLLDSVIDQIDKNKVYCNKINNHVNPTSKYFNDVYPRGDFMIFGERIVDTILHGSYAFTTYGKLYDSLGVDHVDDCLIGVCMKEWHGSEYYELLQNVKYNFIPEIDPDYRGLSKMCIATRLKTVPPGECSGYSWADNEYRLYDVDKFHKVHDILKDIAYDDIKLSDILYDNMFQVADINIYNLTTEQYKKLKSGE